MRCIVSDKGTLHDRLIEVVVKFKEPGYQLPLLREQLSLEEKSDVRSDLGDSIRGQQVLRPVKNGAFPCLTCNCCSICQWWSFTTHIKEGRWIHLLGIHTPFGLNREYELHKIFR
ncbi:hypothetical protein XELAEV_18013521mg [Xenopus laevis]|uniref:Uncharacterized protein n=1 Tax=Xenopus laevis TaxID=8355 RepID=A0A974DRH5_XENLA|nr:hypothetical protein XELAEV_18013521mg [Xenopus laevis]